MDLISWPTENFQDELKAIESELLRVETYIASVLWLEEEQLKL